MFNLVNNSNNMLMLKDTTTNLFVEVMVNNNQLDFNIVNDNVVNDVLGKFKKHVDNNKTYKNVTKMLNNNSAYNALYKALTK